MNTVPFPSPPEVPRLRWRVPIGAAMGILLVASAGYCWDVRRVAHASAADAIEVLTRSRDPTERRGAVAMAGRAATRLIETLREAAAAQDEAGEHARATLTNLHDLTKETNR